MRLASLLSAAWMPLLVGIGLALAPRGAAAAHHLQADSWTVADGLPQNTVTGLTQDRDGYLWVATRKGLARFDGLTFQPVGVVDGIDLSTQRLTTVVHDDEGLWIGTYGAGLLYLRNGRLERFGADDEVPPGPIWDLRRDRQGRIWAATSQGPRVRLDERWQRPTGLDFLREDANSVLVDSRDRVWVATWTVGAVRLDGDEVRNFGAAEGLPVSRVFSLAEDGNGVMWAATPNGIARFNEASQRFERIGAIGDVRAYQLLADRSGTMWVGTYGRGVLRLDPSGAVSAVEGLGSDFVLSLLEDRAGGIWVGTVSGGLTRLLGVRRDLLDADDGLPNFPVTTVYQAPGQPADTAGPYWVGTLGGGLAKFDGSRFTRYSSAQGLPNDSILSVGGRPNGDLWVGTSGAGAFLLRDGRVVERLGPEVVGPAVRTIEVDSDGRVYFAGNGLVRRDPDGSIRRWAEQEGLRSTDLRVLYHTTAGLYIGSFGGGLSLLRPDDTIFTWGVDQGLRSPFVTSVHVDATGVAWVGTYGGGLFRLQDATLRQITEDQGLEDNVIFDINEDRQHRLWLMMNQGISMVELADANRVADGALDVLPSVFIGPADGIRGIDGTDGNQPQSWLADDGRLWFATTDGVVIVDPASVAATDLPPAVHIDRLLVNDESRPLSDSGLDLADRDLVIAFSAPDLRTAGRLRYQYRLVGYDDGWSPADAGRSASYTNLPPGSYRFEVRAQHGRGGAFGQPTALPFTIAPRYYETSWFLALMVLAAGSTLAWAYSQRMRGLRRREQTLQQLVDTRTAALRHEMAERERADAERRALDERVQQAQRLESLGVLAGGIAHDFNNLLVGVLGEAGLAQHEVPPGSRARAHLQRIEQAALQASELTAQMLAYSGRGRFVRTAVDLGDIVRDTLRLLSTLIGRQVVVELALPEHLPAVDGDQAQLRQVVMNLLTNASDAIGERAGRIRVVGDILEITATPDDDRRPPQEDSLPAGRYLRLQVADDGAGMDQATAVRIFEPFFTTKFTGRGLGLAAVQGIVRSHGGRIDVDSTPGAGSTFTVILPAADRPANRPVPRPVPRPPASWAGAPGGAARPAAVVLVVDDERTVRDVARASLEIAGLGVEAVDSGEAALEVFRQTPDRFGLVLLDLTLPGLSGRQVFEAIRAMRPRVPVLLTSGFAVDEVADLVAEPLVDFAAKPWRPQELVAQSQRLLGGPPRPS